MAALRQLEKTYSGGIIFNIINLFQANAMPAKYVKIMYSYVILSIHSILILQTCCNNFQINVLVIKLTKYFGKKNVLEGFYLTVLRTLYTYIYSHVMWINFVFFNILNKRLFYKEIFLSYSLLFRTDFFKFWTK